ncbi:MAG: uroporphyrinogen decarboxylase family protein [Chloroflexota bacterium]
MNRLHGKPVDRVPNFDIIMGFGAHYVGATMSEYLLDHRWMVRANLAMVSDFDIDILQTLTDPFRESVDFGLEVEFPEDGLPKRLRPLLAPGDDIKKVPLIDPGSGRRMSDRIEAVRLLHEQANQVVPVMGWVEGAMAQANDLISDTTMMTTLYDAPEWLTALMERITEVEIAFARIQIDAGADIIGLGDAIASIVSPRMYRQFALPYEKRIFEAVHQKGALARLHICGNTSKILPDMLASGADFIDVDWMVDYARAAETFGGRVGLVGNFDPVSIMNRGSAQTVEKAVLHCLAVGGSNSFSAAGCEIPDGTPPANLHTHARILREAGDQPIAP